MVIGMSKRYYIDKKVFFEVYDDGLVILKAGNRELSRKILKRGVSKSQIRNAFLEEIEGLQKRRIVPSVYGFKAFWKPSLGKIVLRHPYTRRRQRKKT